MKMPMIFLALLSGTTIAHAESFDASCSTESNNPILINTKTHQAAYWTPGQMIPFSLLSAGEASGPYGEGFSFDPETMILHEVDSTGKSIKDLPCGATSYDSRQNAGAAVDIEGSNLRDDQKSTIENESRVVVRRDSGDVGYGSDGKAYHVDPSSGSGSNCVARGTEIYHCD